MRQPELTTQQLDPATTIGAHLSTIAIAAVAVAWAVLRILLGGASASAPLGLALSVGLLAAAAYWLVRSAGSLRAPFPRRSLVGVYCLGLLAFASESWAFWGTDDFIRDDWSPMSLGLLTIAMTPYRPARELVIGTLTCSVIIGLVTLAKVPYLATDAPGFAFVLMSLSPLLGLGLGGARYAQLLVRALTRWHRRADVATAALAVDLSNDIARSVHDDRVTILSRDVVPFFAGLLARERITDEDRATARSIAESIRGVMVADAGRTWLDAAVAAIAPTRGAAIVVDDPDFVASLMDHRQRTALRALVIALADDAGVEHASVRLERSTDSCAVTVVAGARGTERAIQSAYVPYFAVLRIVFTGFVVASTSPQLIARFSYDRS